MVDHGVEGTGQPLAALLREGRANATTAGDQIALVDAALARLPEQVRGRVLVRGDAAAGVPALLHHLAALGPPVLGGRQRRSTGRRRAGRPASAVLAARDRRRRPGPGRGAGRGADPSPARHPHRLAGRAPPAGNARIRVRSCGSPITTGGGSPWSRPPPLAAGSPSWRCGTGSAPAPTTASAGSTTAGRGNLPLHEFAKNVSWLELVQLAAELLTWTQTLAVTGSAARCWEPKRVRLRLLHVAGRLVTTGRRHWLRLPRGWPWAELIISGHARLHALT